MEGVIKYTCNWIQRNVLDADQIEEINYYRKKLYQLNLIGLDADGIGFGNISVRAVADQFIVSGSGTGAIEVLNETHYVRVLDYTMATHTLTCAGQLQASSESMTHATIYQCDPTCNAIIHIHHTVLWNQLLNKVPTASAKDEYGSPGMVQEVLRLHATTNLNEIGLMVMAGHENGVIAFGNTLEQAFERITANL